MYLNVSLLLHFKIKARLVEKFGIEGREKSFFFSFYCMEILPNEPNGEMAKALLARLHEGYAEV